MNDYTIQFTVDGHAVSEQKILDMELSRYHHVFKIFHEKQVDVQLDGKVLNLEQLLELPLEKAKVL